MNKIEEKLEKLESEVWNLRSKIECLEIRVHERTKRLVELEELVYRLDAKLKQKIAEKD